MIHSQKQNKTSQETLERGVGYQSCYNIWSKTSSFEYKEETLSQHIEK